MRNDSVDCDGELVPRLSDQKRGGCMVNPSNKYQCQSSQTKPKDVGFRR